MKKIYSFLAVATLTALSANAQTNLVTNGGFENWTNDTTPVNFDPLESPSINNFLTKEATTIHGGSFSAKHQSQDAATQYVEASELISVTPGHSYTISYWYLDNSDAAKTRIWSAWLASGSTTQLDDNADVLRPAPASGEDDTPYYSVDNPAWVQKTLTLTAPAGAGRFRFQVRTYRQTTGVAGGYIYYDDFSFVDNGVAGLAQNNITGLNVFPNPLTGNVLNITSNSNAAKTVAIYDVLGKQVVNATTANNTVNVNGLNAGVYIVKITEEGKTATRKLVVQ